MIRFQKNPVIMGRMLYRVFTGRAAIASSNPEIGSRAIDFYELLGFEVFSETGDPIANALLARGYTVWLDEAELKIGDRLLDMIDEGLANCRFGVVILSESFFGKRWTRRELAGLVARQDAEDRKYDHLAGVARGRRQGSCTAPALACGRVGGEYVKRAQERC